MDAEDPTCAKITLTGVAIPLDDDQIKKAMVYFKAQHPRAGWLSKGGAHTGGGYYTIDIHSISFLRTYGGFATVSPDEYTNWKPDSSKYAGEEQCEGSVGSLAKSQYQVSSQEESDSGYSSLSIVGFVVLASFFGSFLGGMLSEKLRSYRGRPNRYSVTGSEENSFELAVTEGIPCKTIV